jgi:hypothetical protein
VTALVGRGRRPRHRHRATWAATVASASIHVRPEALTTRMEVFGERDEKDYARNQRYYAVP